MRLFRIIIKVPFRFLSFLYYRLRFKQFGLRSIVHKPLRINGWHNISIGNYVEINNYGWLAALPHTNSSFCQLLIEDGVTIGDFSHLYATQCITIRKNALLANHVYISDNLHGYDDITKPIAKQPIKQCAPVVIGENSWIGENVCIIGASVGKNSVVGANSVVTHDIPDFCVAAGAPAKIIKTYDAEQHMWIKQ